MDNSTTRPKIAHPTIGLLTIGNFLGYLPQHWLGVVDAARERGFNLICYAGTPLHSPRGFEVQGNAVFDQVSSEVINGLIVWTSVLDWYVDRQVMVDFCHRFSPIPVVSAEVQVDGIPSILVDHYGGMREVLTHLINAHGRRRIAFLRGPEGHLGAQERYRAYLDVLSEHHIHFEPNLVTPPLDDWEGSSGIRILMDDNGVHPRTDFDAVAGVGDGAANGALQELKVHGIRIPEDVAVVGFDDNLGSGASSPSMTTINPLIYEVGQQAVSLLINLMHGEEVPQKMIVPARLIVRQSCGCLSQSVIPPSDKIINHHTTALEKLGFGIPLQDGYVVLNELRRNQIVLDMAQAILRFSNRATLQATLIQHLQDLVKGFYTDIQTENNSETGIPSLFLGTLANVLSQEGEAVGLSAWQEALSVFRSRILALIGNDEIRAIAENLFHQARVNIGDAAQHYQLNQRQQEINLNQILSEVGQAVTTAVDMEELLDVLAKELPRLGLPGSYLSLYEKDNDSVDKINHSTPEWSRLIFHYNEQSYHTEVDENHRLFLSKYLVPKELLVDDKIANQMLISLYFRDDPLGFILFDVETRNGRIFDILRGQIGAALKSVMLHNEANQARMAAEQANRLKTRLMAMVSHELRTPLNLIVGLSEIMLARSEPIGSGQPETFQEDIKRVYLSAQLLNGLIGDVLDLARSEVGEIKLVRELLDIREVLTTVIQIGAQWAQDKGLDWRVELPKEIPRIWGDRVRIRQILLNLLSNAFKFTAIGEIVLSVKINSDCLIILVSDTGLGIPPQEQDLIFNEFRQSERSTLRGFGGLGLGLTICKRLVEMHRGKIGVLSTGKEGEGSTFYFTLPLIEQKTPGSPASKRPCDLTPRIVILSGEDQINGQIQEYLKKQGYQVDVYQVTKDGDLTWLVSTPPHAVVLDMAVASQQGWEMLKILKERSSTRDIPVLFYNLNNETGDGALLEMEYLTKPVGMSALEDILARLGPGKTREGEKYILVVDDEPEVREMHTRMIETQLPDYHVMKAGNGREALEIMQVKPPSLLLLDLMMPELDGFTVLDIMRSQKHLQDIPVIVLTGQTLTEEDMQRLNRGVTSVLGKGLFSVDETLIHMQTALNRSKGLSNDARRLMRKAMSYIHDHYTEPISRKDVADYVSVSESHLSRCFHQEAGIPLQVYLNRYRVNQSKKLLTNSDKSITEIALEVGFSDGNYFSRLFHKEVGVSPRNYRHKV